MIVLRRVLHADEVVLARQIRAEVFINEMGRMPHMEWEHEEEATVYMAYMNTIPIGTARYLISSEGIELQRFAILPAYRRQGAGSLLLQHLLNEVKDLGKPIFLHTYMQTIGFYAKANFVCNGNPYIYPDDGIAYVRMVKL
jgi:GNAT superfamily N-acetyltransferase